MYGSHSSSPSLVSGFLISDSGISGKIFRPVSCNDLFSGQGKERIHKSNGRMSQLVHVVLDILRIRGNDRAVVVVVGIRKFISLVREYTGRK